LKLFTGEYDPKNYMMETGINKFRDQRRLFINEMPEIIQAKIIKFFEKNRIGIVNDIIRGRGGLAADWLLVTRFNKESNSTTWTLKKTLIPRCIFLEVGMFAFHQREVYTLEKLRCKGKAAHLIEQNCSSR